MFLGQDTTHLWMCISIGDPAWPKEKIGLVLRLFRFQFSWTLLIRTGYCLCFSFLSFPYLFAFSFHSFPVTFHSQLLPILSTLSSALSSIVSSMSMWGSAGRPWRDGGQGGVCYMKRHCLPRPFVAGQQHGGKLLLAIGMCREMCHCVVVVGPANRKTGCCLVGLDIVWQMMQEWTATQQPGEQD